jgi:flotillin
MIIGSILKMAVPIVIAIFVILILAMGYVKAPPDTAFIISGLRKRTIIGKASVKIPFLERIDKVSLKLIPIDVKTSSAVPTADYINIRVDAAVNVKVSDQKDKLALAAQNFLNVKPEYIGQVAREVLEGNMREIVGQMKLEEMVSDRQKFAEMVKTNAEPDLAGMGLDIVSFNVQNFIDDNSVIENLGVDNIVQISKKAAIARAEAEKEIAVATAKANRESNEAEVAANTEIAKKQNELAIQKAELKKQADIKLAEAEAAKGIQAEEQRKTLEITTANANLAKQEKEIELKEREVTIKERSLEAEVKKTAEAQKYATQQNADAQLYSTQKKSEAELFERAKQAEAQQIEAEREAAAKIALAEAQKQQGIAEAEATRAKGEAEAAAIKAKLDAEAEGLMKKAEAMKQYGDAAKQQMELDTIKVFFEQLPAIAEAAGKAYTNVDKIYMYGEGGTNLTGDIIKNMTQVSEGLSQSIGLDLKSMLAGFIGGKATSSKDSTTVEVYPANYTEVKD